MAETAEDAVAEQASSESLVGAEAFSAAPVQQPTPQFDSSMFEKAPISSAQGFGTVPNPAAAGSADKPLFNLILPIVAIALSVIFAILAWFVSPAWLFIILTVLAVAAAVVSLVFSLKSSKKLLSIIATGVAGLMLFVSIGGLIFQISQNAGDNTSSSKTSKVADKDDDDANKKDDDSDSKSDSKGDNTDVNDYIDKNAKFDWNESKFKKLKAGKDTVKSIIKTYGKASDAQISGDERKLNYSGNNYVRLTFEKKDVVYVLKSASATFDYDKVKEVDDYHSNWTKDDYEKLSVGTQADLLKGTRLSEVVEKHPEASFTYHEMTQTEQGDFTQSVSLSYRDYNPESGKVDAVRLTFDYDKRENKYFLTDKSDE